MASKIFNSLAVRGPKFSYFDMSHPNLVSMKFGEIPVIYWDYLNPGDKAIFDMSQVVRLSPMLQPILSQIDITVDAFAVRLRTLGMAERNPWQYEDFFNANKNLSGEYSLPSAKVSDIGASVNFKKGTLYDFLGYPTLEAFKSEFRKELNKFPYLYSSTPAWVVYADDPEDLASYVVYLGSMGLPGAAPIADFNLSMPSEKADAFIQRNVIVTPGDFASVRLNNFELSSSSVSPTIVPPLVLFALHAGVYGLESAQEEFSIGYLGLIEYVDFTDEFASLAVSWSTSGLTFPDWFYRTYKIDWQTVEDAYFDFVFSRFVINGYVRIPSAGSYIVNSVREMFIDPLFVDNVTSVSYAGTSEGFGSDDIASPADPSGVVPSVSPFYNGIYPGDNVTELYSPLYPALSYWKIISDWFLNTGLFNPEDWYLNKVFSNFADKEFNLASIFGDCYHRNWKNDYFTSAFSEAQRGLAVGVPADGTIPDLRNANALQKFKERLLFAGHKFRDVVYSIFGIKMSNVVSDQSEPLGRWINPVNIDSVLQTSQSSAESALASYSGTGLSFGHKSNILRYEAEEPTVIMFLASIRPKDAVYFQGLPRKLTRNFLMDYAIPQFVNVGEQMISERELYCDYRPYDGTSPSSLHSNLFGFTRRFADFMFAPGEVHGDFKDSLDSWHLARKFDSAPSLNQEFLEVRGVEDNLNRIFASVSDATDKFYCNFYFSGGIVRSLPKRVYYDL